MTHWPSKAPSGSVLQPEADPPQADAAAADGLLPTG